MLPTGKNTVIMFLANYNISCLNGNTFYQIRQNYTKSLQLTKTQFSCGLTQLIPTTK